MREGPGKGGIEEKGLQRNCHGLGDVSSVIDISPCRGCGASSSSARHKEWRGLAWRAILRLSEHVPRLLRARLGEANGGCCASDKTYLVEQTDVMSFVCIK